MIAPGSKGWIAKYLQLIESGDISIQLPKPKKFSRDEFNHFILARTGLVFGFPAELLLSKSFDSSKWTQDEHLSVLLFEAQLITHYHFHGKSKFKPDVFLADLYAFYKKHKVQSLSSVLTFFLKESISEKIEKILENRVDVPMNLVNTKSWINYFNNAFIYLDVILFEEFLKNGRIQKHNYQELALFALAIISISAYSDGEIKESEKILFQVFLMSADLDSDEKELAKLRFKDGISLNELSSEIIDIQNYKRYLLNLSVLTMHMNKNLDELDLKTLHELRTWLNCSERDLDEAIFTTNQFLLVNNQRVAYLKDAGAVESMIESVSKRWIKILGRNKDKLALELKQSKELVYLIKKSTTEDLTKEEKEKVKVQFLDIAKSMPALAIFLLPGGALLLPIVLKIIPNLIPSAFKDNELEE